MKKRSVKKRKLRQLLRPSGPRSRERSSSPKKRPVRRKHARSRRKRIRPPQKQSKLAWKR